MRSVRSGRGPHRRDVLKGLGAAAATGGLVGCKPGDDTDGLIAPGIDHIIVLCMENRSFDHVFGGMRIVEGQTDVEGPTEADFNLDLDGNPVYPQPEQARCPNDPPHGWDASAEQFEEGTNAGFVREYEARNGPGSGPAVMGYQVRAQQPITYALADRYALCNRYFASLLGPTWPNRFYLHGAQSQGMTSNTLPDGLPYTMKSIWDQLDEIDVAWDYYYTDLPMLALFGRFDDRLKTVEQFFTDAAAGNLAPIVMVEPSAGFGNDHPPNHTMFGQMFIGSIFNALATSPVWNRCLFLLTYDEGGGFWDHVPPPAAPDDRTGQFANFGFRVPGLVAGPYVREAHRSAVQFDHTSWLAHVQGLYGLPPLTARDAAANDLWSLIDEDRLAAGDARAPAELPVIAMTEDEIRAECARTRRRRTGWPEMSDALVRLGKGHLDRTDDLERIGWYLAEQAMRLGVITVR